MPSVFHTSFPRSSMPRGHSEALFHTRVLPPCNWMPATPHNCSANMLYTASRAVWGNDNVHINQERENELPFPQLHLHIRQCVNGQRRKRNRGTSGSPCSPPSAWWMICFTPSPSTRVPRQRCHHRFRSVPLSESNCETFSEAPPQKMGATFQQWGSSRGTSPANQRDPSAPKCPQTTWVAPRTPWPFSS